MRFLPALVVSVCFSPSAPEGLGNQVLFSWSVPCSKRSWGSQRTRPFKGYQVNNLEILRLGQPWGSGERAVPLGPGFRPRAPRGSPKPRASPSPAHLLGFASACGPAIPAELTESRPLPRQTRPDPQGSGSREQIEPKTSPKKPRVPNHRKRWEVLPARGRGERGGVGRRGVCGSPCSRAGFSSHLRIWVGRRGRGGCWELSPTIQGLRLSFCGCRRRRPPACS